MKIIISAIKENGTYELYLDKGVFVIKKGNQEIKIESNEQERVNTLISLFSLKSIWKKDNVESDYQVSFYNKDSVDTFYFSNSFPSNWMIFLGSLEKLAGEGLWKTIQD
ncbi:MAG: hypothetical protein IKJ30_00645 [Bacilli bacterium]|nr:hypothetical protein [Bacilli bacterium]